MRSIEVELSKSPEVKAVVLAAFPSYRKKKAYLSAETEVTLHGTYWDGGSRSEYCAVDLVTHRRQGMPHYNPPQFGGPRTAPVAELRPGLVIVEAGTFCGKPATAHVSIHPDNLAKLLPAPSPV